MASLSQDTSIAARRLTYALHQRRELSAALDQLTALPSSALIIEALAQLLDAQGVPFDLAIQALNMLAPLDHPIALDALINATEHPLIKVRRTAIELLCLRADALPWPKLFRQLVSDNAYQVRVVLVTLLAKAPEPARWGIVRAIDDPHWRVRKSLVTALQGWSQTEGAQAINVKLRHELAARALDGDRARGVLAYLELYDHDARAVDDCEPAPYHAPLELELTARPWWSEEPTLMKANLKALSKSELRDEERWLVWLLTHPDEQLRSSMLSKLGSALSTTGVLSFLIHVSEPRRADRDAVCERLLERVSQDTLERCAWLILEDSAAGISLVTRAGLPKLQHQEGALIAWALTWLYAHIPHAELDASEHWHEALASSFDATHNAQRSAALEIIAAMESAPTRLPTLADKLHPLAVDDDSEVASAALRALTKHAPSQALSLLDAPKPQQHALDPLYLVACVDALAAHPIDDHLERWQTYIASTFAQVRARCALHLALASSASAEAEALLHPLQHDSSSQVRLAALTAARCARLTEDPAQEPSWRVLAQVAQRAGRRLDALVPPEWIEPLSPVIQVQSPSAQPDVTINSNLDALDTSGDWWRLRPLGNTSLMVSKMGISGHYMLPEDGFAQALDRGINTFFWEPIYLSQTRYFKSISRARKAELVTCCGTFEASAKGMRRDIERALKSMDLEQLQVFYIFWIRERERLSDELLTEMARCQRDGLVHTFGVSTHSRELAREFVQTWPAVMVRHNAAHHGIERDVLPYVDPAKVGVTTFSNLCYGRMLSELPDWRLGIPSAPDAYRYSLSHHGVTSCWSAPSSIAQLQENLSALTLGPMSTQELDALRAYGQSLYRLNTGFNRFIRQR